MKIYREEILFIHKMITHPAGYNVDLFGSMITIRSHSDGYEVSWECDEEVPFRYRDFTSSLRAAATFVWLRHKYEYGLDYETSLAKSALLI